MAEQRQSFRFRLPWLAASQPQPAQTSPPPAPRPRTPAQTPTPAPAQRPPFLPAGVARPVRAEPQQPSPPRASPQIQELPKAAPQAPPRPTPFLPSQPPVRSPFPPKREPEEAQPIIEKVVESLIEEKKLQETKQQPIKVEEPKDMPDSDSKRSDESKQTAAVPDVVIDKREVQGHERMTRAAHKHAIREKKEDSPKLVQKTDNPYSVITLSGENTGATMHLSRTDSSSKKEKPIHIHREYKNNPYESAAKTTDGDEGKSKNTESEDTKHAPEEEEATKNIYVNNNVQGINNSLVFNSSMNERNPGVHLVLSHTNPVQTVVKPGKESQTVEARKAEVSTTSTERLAYAPTIRRRCLRGLFLESSDSEPDNPEKARRHGCRVGCNQKSKEGKIDVL